MLNKVIFFVLVCSSFGFGSPSSPPRGKKYNLSVCAIFKNEGKYLKEWIEYHRLIGVDHFYLYNNNSIDRPNQILKAYLNENIVTLIHWPDCLGNLSEENTFMWSLATQTSAYQHAIKLKHQETKWLLIMDIDEFLVPIDESLTEVLEKHTEFPGVILERYYFDASYANTLPKRNLVIESVEMINAPKENVQKSVEKIIFKPELVEQFTWPPFKCVFKKDKEALPMPKSKIRINRYINRNKSYSITNSKGKLNLDPRKISETEIRELLEAGYEIEEYSISRYVPALIKKMGF